jgi:hypothetical protein
LGDRNDVGDSKASQRRTPRRRLLDDRLRGGAAGDGRPFWSLMIIAVDVVALWGLCAYGSRENLTA